MENDQWAKSVLDAVNKLANSPSNNWNQAATYTRLPDPTTCSGETWLVLAGTGVWPVNKPSGWYYSNETTWLYLGAYNPVVTGGNVVVTNFPAPGTTGEGSTVMVSPNGSQLLFGDADRKGFVLTLETGIVYIGVGFMPSNSQYTYRMTNNSVVEKDGFVGPIYAITDEGSKEIYITEIK